MANPFASDPPESLAGGIFDYQTRLDRNFQRMVNVGTIEDGRIVALEAGLIGGAADAASNVHNLLFNGGFLQVSSGPLSTASNYIASIPVSNPTYNTEVVRHSEGWYFFADAGVGGLIVANHNPALPGAIGAWPGIKVAAGSLGSPYTGYVFQRLDYFLDLDALRGRKIYFGVLYTAVSSGEFYLEVDDGVTQTTNLSTPPAAGSGRSDVFHTVDANATKLTVKIVFPDDAAATNNLQILYAYAKAGVQAATLMQAVPPIDVARDKVLAQTVSKDIEYAPLVAASSFSNVNKVDEVRLYTHWDIPFIAPASTDIVTAVYVAGASVDPRDVALLAAAPVITLRGPKRSFINGPRAALATSQVEYFAADLYLYRDQLGALDPNPAPWQFGFYSDELVAFIRNIPAA